MFKQKLRGQILIRRKNQTLGIKIKFSRFGERKNSFTKLKSLNLN